MSRPILAALCLLALPAYSLAQSDAAAAGTQDPQAAYNQLVKAWNKAYAEWQEKAQQAYNEAQKARKPVPAIVRNPPTKEYVERAQALALEYAGEEIAVQFHTFVLKYASKEAEAVKKTLLTLTMDHAESEAIGGALSAGYFARAARMGATSEVMDLLGEVIEFNGSSECKAKALLARGSLRLEQRDDEERAAGQQDLERIAELTKDADLLAQANDALFEIRHLQIGCEAPDIVGKDIDGVAFKLSDYRGKVVLLDFWGFW